MIELVASIGQRIGFSRLSRAEHRDQTFVLVDRQGDLMLGYGALFLVFALLGGVSTGLVAFSNKALATLVGNMTTGLMIFCLVATAYHGLLAVYSGRKFSR